jgi:membrane fusion protein (multidrug efflux system)
MKNIISLSILVLALLGGMASCDSHRELPVSETTNQSLKVFSLHRGSLGRTIHLPGELRAYEEVAIYAKVNSFVREVLVDRGTAVKKGQNLVLLDAPELDAQYHEAEDRLRSRESTLRSTVSYYNRLLQTSKTPGTVSQNDLEQAEAKMKADSSEVSSLGAAFRAVSELRNYLTVKAPFDGIISERNIHPGALVGPGGKGSDLPMLRLEEEGLLRLIVAVPEIHTSAIHDKEEVKFVVKAYPSDTFRAIVSRISGSLDVKTRSELIEMDAPNAGHKLLPGMYAEVELPISRSEPSFVVPLSAILSNTEGLFVIRIAGGKAERIPVRKGNESAGRAEVFGVLNENDAIVEEASEQIHDGQSVRSL